MTRIAVTRDAQSFVLQMWQVFIIIATRHCFGLKRFLSLDLEQIVDYRSAVGVTEDW